MRPYIYHFPSYDTIEEKKIISWCKIEKEGDYNAYLNKGTI
jgi:hypothetical protein